MYQFKKCPIESTKGAFYGLKNIYDEPTELQHSLCLGQLITLFGEPNDLTEDYEYLYTYAISAQDTDGNILYLMVTGNSPMILGEDNEAHNNAAEELAQLIVSTKPSDYDHQCVYEDIPVSIKFGVRNGEPYSESDMSDFDF
ncbi:MAG: hypothetical protein IJ192_07755 [Clostridia bacterium]|nr:hypothetical protein [Clostridia bacterium]MBR2175390.1 hypothetical protein [Clostridia bacterium]